MAKTKNEIYKKKEISKKRTIDKFHSLSTHPLISARQRILFLNRFHNEPATRASSRVRPFVSTSVSSTRTKNNRRREFLLRSPERNEMKFLLEENREWRRAAIGKSKGINPGPPLGRSGILSTRRVETTTQVLLSLIVKEPRICAAEILRNNRTNEAFAKAFAEGLPPLPPPVRRKKPSAEEFKKETCRSEQQPRCVTKNTARTGFERSSRERLERNTTPLLEQEALLFAVWTSTVRFTDLIFYKFQESKYLGQEITQFLCATTREYLLFPILLVAEVVGYICNC